MSKDKQETTLIIKGKAQFAFLTSPNKKSKKYQIDVVGLSKADVKALEAIGITVHDEADKPEKKKGYGRYITAKSSMKPRSNNVVDATGKPLGDDILIGNDSVVEVKVKAHPYIYEGTHGIMTALQAVKVVDLIEYTGGGLDGFTFDEAEEQAPTSTDDIPF